MVRLNYDEGFKVIGAYLEGDIFEGPYVEVEDTTWQDLNNQNKLIYLDKDDPSDLSKVTLVEDIQEPTPEIIQLLKDGLKSQARREAEATLQRIRVNEIAKTLPVEKVLEIKILFPEWKDLIGKAITKADYPYILDDGILYNLQQDTLVQEQFKPSMPGMLAIYAPVIKNPTVEGPQPWKQPIPPQSYNKGDQVTHKGFVWESGVAGNVWEPGAVGVYDNIWKKVREV